MVGDDDVARTAVQGYQHGGGRLLRGQDVGVLDLRQAGVIPDGAQLARGGGTGQVSHACSIGISAVLLRQGDDGGIVVRVAEIDLRGALRRDGLTGNDAVHVAAHDGGDQAVPVQLDDLDLLAQRLADLLGHHDVVAVGVVAGAADLHSAVGIIVLSPVVGGVGALHRNGQSGGVTVAVRGGGGVSGGLGALGCGGIRSRGGGGSGVGAGAAGGQTGGHHSGKAQGQRVFKLHGSWSPL